MTPFHEILLGMDLLVAIVPSHVETGGSATICAAWPGRDRSLPKDLAESRNFEPRPWLPAGAKGGSRGRGRLRSLRAAR